MLCADVVVSGDDSGDDRGYKTNNHPLTHKTKKQKQNILATRSTCPSSRARRRSRSTATRATLAAAAATVSARERLFFCVVAALVPPSKNTNKHPQLDQTTNTKQPHNNKQKARGT